jgi:hypothetical protein
MPCPPAARRTLALLPVALLLAACGEVPSEVPSDPDHAGLHASVGGGASVASAGLLKAVHAATSRFHSTAQALKAGYAADPHCVAVPGLGGMGYHWANFGLVDPVFEPNRPEVVLYAPDGKGNLKLVAVEYIVINVGQPAPTFDGHPFDVGGTPVPVPHWSLHVWVHRDNPNGTFTPFNPAVSCAP